MICIHFESLYESLEANLIALKYKPFASELIDHYILECTKENIAQRKNRFFIQGDPKALLIVEIAKDNPDDLDKAVNQLIAELKSNNYGYHYPVLKGSDVGKIWSLRKAGWPAKFPATSNSRPGWKPCRPLCQSCSAITTCCPPTS